MSLSDHWPTRDERAFFEREGYLVVPDALSPAQVSGLTEAIERCRQREESPPEAFYNRLDILGQDDAFLELVDNPAVLGRISGLLGWNIWVNHTHYNVRPPDASAEKYRYDWHVDGGMFSQDLQFQPPMTAIKVGFYLTDLVEPGRGQTFIYPLSLMEERNWREEFRPFTAPPAEARPLTVKAGSAVLFQQRTLHSQGSPNLSAFTRKAIFVQWAFRWLFPVDEMSVGALDARVQDPVRRQLLGLDRKRPFGRLSAKYYPRPEDLPLKNRLIEQVGISRMCELGPSATRHLTQLLKFEL
ncbi:phytanoyl-CoA dioxygenase family protein [Corallococcus sp. 4LFB]|uniref:phytanoyl-CoA dioxygenase family protein n=1 Tax=Corallococcus sp. 4LFB TaxID=3383249 RepID=UPI0039765368